MNYEPQPTAYNKQNTDAPFVDMAQLKLWKEIVVVAQCFLPRVGIAPSGAEKWVVDSALRRIIR